MQEKGIKMMSPYPAAIVAIGFGVRVFAGNKRKKDERITVSFPYTGRV